MTLEFIWALGAIVLIDVVLGGENALVIAMASRKLEPNLRKKALIWGTFGAVAVRFLCVAALTYLLMIPGLRLIGGLALLYIKKLKPRLPFGVLWPLLFGLMPLWAWTML